MKLRIALLTVALGACAAPPPYADRQAPPVELAGRSAGPPKRCISLMQLEALRVSETDRHTLVYGNGKTIWANHLGPSCGFGWNDILVTEPTGSQLCGGDIVRSIDRNSHIPGPSCVLGDFVPYTR
ncbi:MAG TPA: hypothetical protein VF750_07050 [Sphingomicrobium sp.]